MGNAVTTTSNFRVEDCTFHNIRFQDEIKNEIQPGNDISPAKVQPPDSLTPGQLIKYYEECCNSDGNSPEIIAVYQQTIKYLRKYEQYSRAAASKLLDKYIGEEKV